ncbi:MAG: Crp/Fnr family transcriptional regulator [Clostridiales bacterium]|nr:Crp/Fnr family transcriptional regulator [Clostridiales bacterium]MCF8023038.1 Crp/Fnr family transcriptional regulator [Clostridiales bacterium]
MSKDFFNLFTQLYLAPWLTSAEPDIFTKFIKLGRKKIYKKNTTILEQGNKVENIYYLNKGKIKVMLLSESGDEKVFWYTTESNIFGDVPFFSEMNANASIVAEEECEVYVFNKKQFLQVIQSETALAEHMLKMMAKKIKILIGQVQDIAFNKPDIRINKLLFLLAKQFSEEDENKTEIKLNITHKEIASITGLHRVTVTNVLNKIRQEDIIKKSQKGNIIINDIDELYKNAFYI